uniref:3'-5' exoribonuclease 1-like n=1 Tax=Styela clava TaxID=7725 RepID=UPI00193A3AD7|nr:3'-5' exoribonuclease 1-like [Styela clava]
MEKKSRRRPRRDEDEVIDSFSQLSLSRVNGEVNKMKKVDMIKLLKKNSLNSNGVKEVLGRRLKNYYRKQRMKEESDTVQCYENFVVIDFEATCESGRNLDYLHEIIEFPAMLLDAETGKIVDEFHSYCKPTLNPKLSEFCVSLTGISQSDVDAAPKFEEVFKRFENWMIDKNLLMDRKSFAFVSDGPWDFSRFLNIQCCLSEIQYPKWARKWINLKKIFGNFYKINKPKIEEMLSNLGLKLEGRLHSGLDDAKNLSRIVAKLVEDGCVLQINERLNAGRLEPVLQTDLNKFKAKLEVTSAQSGENHICKTEVDSDLNKDFSNGKRQVNCETEDCKVSIPNKPHGSTEDLSNKLDLCKI